MPKKLNFYSPPRPLTTVSSTLDCTFYELKHIYPCFLWDCFTTTSCFIRWFYEIFMGCSIFNLSWDKIEATLFSFCPTLHLISKDCIHTNIFQILLHLVFKNHHLEIWPRSYRYILEFQDRIKSKGTVKDQYFPDPALCLHHENSISNPLRAWVNWKRMRTAFRTMNLCFLWQKLRVL